MACGIVQQLALDHLTAGSALHTNDGSQSRHRFGAGVNDRVGVGHLVDVGIDLAQGRCHVAELEQLGLRQALGNTHIVQGFVDQAIAGAHGQSSG